jgi:hypothetical protein
MLCYEDGGAGTALVVRSAPRCELSLHVETEERRSGRNGVGKKGKRKEITKQMPVTYEKSGKCG